MTIKGGLQSKAPGNPYDETDEGVFISVIKEDSVAGREGRLCVGQRIIEVNGQNLLGAEHGEAVNTLRSGTNCIKIGLPGKLILSKRKGLWEVIFS